LALQKVHRLVKPGGLLYMECPNLGAPFAPPGRLFHSAHIHNFTRTTLNAMAACCGFYDVHWLSAAEDRDLAGVWRRGEAADTASCASGYAEVQAALRRFNWWTYHARLPYLRTRSGKVAGYLLEQLQSRRFVRRLERRLAQLDAAAENEPQRRAA
jgi:hypothetical protein